ncbi:MAG: ribosomal-processing cysteine protease Prp [Cohnella sp.]|nr:ribosomal-processing cysteine protease Prp [Cohnella sp.]
MITITIERSEAGRIRRFSVSGHAKYKDSGRDIVCAGVSAVTVGAVNAIEKLTGLVPEAEMRGGWLTAEAPLNEDGNFEEQAQLLLEGMVAALESIADEYTKYVQIKEIFT